MTWIIENKDWLFSGVALAIIGVVIRWFKGSSATSINRQVQKGGKNSTNIQIGSNSNIGSKKDD